MTGQTFLRELWKSDGTTAGTARAVSIQASRLSNLDGKLLFETSDSETGSEPWVSDGTPAGTYLAKDINPGVEGSLNGASAIVPLIHSAVLSASDSATGLELWKTNGQWAGTVPVQEIFPGPRSSSPAPFVQAANQVFFLADDGIHGRELWVIPLQALGVSLEEQIDQLRLVLSDPTVINARRTPPLTAALENARRFLSSTNGQGNLTAARAHLINFHQSIRRLIERGDISVNNGKQLADGARYRFSNRSRATTRPGGLRKVVNRTKRSPRNSAVISSCAR